MNTLNPAAVAALEQDAQKYLEAAWEFHELAGPNWDEVARLLTLGDALDLEGETVAKVKQLLGLDSTTELMLQILKVTEKQSRRNDAENAYIKTRRLLTSMGLS